MDMKLPEPDAKLLPRGARKSLAWVGYVAAMLTGVVAIASVILPKGQGQDRGPSASGQVAAVSISLQPDTQSMRILQRRSDSLEREVRQRDDRERARADSVAAAALSRADSIARVERERATRAEDAVRAERARTDSITNAERIRTRRAEEAARLARVRSDSIARAERARATRALVERQALQMKMAVDSFDARMTRLAAARRATQGGANRYDVLEIRNKCSDTVWIALRYSALDAEWVTHGWWMVPPNGVVTPSIQSTGSQIFFHAHSRKDTWGSGRDLRVLDWSFVIRPGTPVDSLPTRVVSFGTWATGSQWGTVTKELSCSRG